MNDLQQLVSVLRSRTWLSPVAADEMNRRDRWLADQIEDALSAGQRSAAPSASQSVNPIRVPFTRALTVIVPKDTGAEHAAASLVALKEGRSQEIVVASEMFFHRLRLAVAEDPTLADQIAVFYKDGDSIVGPIGLRFEDELRWPVGFLHGGWELEVMIDKVRQRGV